MLRHLSANLWLLLLTVVICAVLYPLALLGIGQGIFPAQANGSLIPKTDDKGAVVKDDKGEPVYVGSALIAQAFSGDEYFQPRPSAVSYNAAASGASNWGANNPALRKRVLGQLGSVLRYGPAGAKPGKLIGPDIEAWVQKEIKPPQLTPARTRKQIQDEYYEMWRERHPLEDLAPVPADMVTTSGSGLDPHITLKNALYQVERVSGAWAEKTKLPQKRIAQELHKLLEDSKESPLRGTVGVDLINVLQVNLVLPERIKRLSR